jgi:hypothetical protein
MKIKNNSNKMLLIILIILIILCIIYLYLKNNDVNKEIENFDYNLGPQSTQQSLSIYSVNLTDTNTRGIDYSKTKINSTGKTQESRAHNWNGYWKSISNDLYMSLLQINDILILSINNIKVSNNIPYNDIKENSENTFIATDLKGKTFNSSTNCPLNNITAICQLNFNRTKFYIKDPTKNIYCNNLIFINSSLEFNIFLAGYIDGNNIVVSYYDSKIFKMVNIAFNKDTTMNNSYENISASYSLTETNLINPYPKIPTSNVSYSYNGYDNKNTFMPINILSQYITNDNNNNSYKLCSLINNINNNNKTLAYIFYIDNFINVQSLDYNFWGVGKNDSNLVLKNTNLAYSFALKLKKFISNNNIIFSKITEYSQQISSYMYCSESNDKDSNFTQELNDLKNNFNNNKNQNLSNKKTPVFPIVWNISTTYKSSTCYMSLSSVPDKNNTVKYPEFNSDGSINMSINDRGTNQQLIFEDISTIKNESNYFISTGYFRTNDLLYLVSNNSNKTLQGDNTVKLVSKPSPSGRWVIIGFNDKANVNNIINEITPNYT